LQEFIHRIWTNDNHVILKQEIDALKSSILMKDSVGEKEQEQRKKLYQVAKRFMMQIGLIQKHYRILGAENEEKEQ
jgi:hypothetical protein